MAGEHTPQNNEPSTHDRASKVILRMATIEGCVANQEQAHKVLQHAARGISETIGGDILIADAENNDVFFGVSNTPNVSTALPVVVQVAHSALRSGMMPYEISGARAASDTYNVSTAAVWRNLGLDPSNDVTAKAQEILEAERDQMWEADRTQVYTVGGPEPTR